MYAKHHFLCKLLYISVKCEITRCQNVHDKFSDSSCKHVTIFLTKMYAYLHKYYNRKSHDCYVYLK